MTATLIQNVSANELIENNEALIRQVINGYNHTNCPDYAADSFQDVCLQIVSQANKYNPEFAQTTWVHTVAKNTLIRNFNRSNAQKRGGATETSDAIRTDQMPVDDEGYALDPEDYRIDNGIQDQFEAIKPAINVLKPREQMIVLSFFGIGTDAKTLDQLAETLNVTKQRVGQIKDKAIERIQTYIADKAVRSAVV